MDRTSVLVEQSGLEHELSWQVSGLPFLNRKDRLISTATRAITEVMGFAPRMSTSGGTSDGRFIAPSGVEVIELGPLNATIHKDNECVKTTELESLTDIYQRILELSLTQQDPVD